MGPGVSASASVLRSTNTKRLTTTLQLLAASHLYFRAGSLRSLTAIRKEAGLFCRSFLLKGEVFADVGLCQNLKHLQSSQRTWSWFVPKRRVFSLYLGAIPRVPPDPFCFFPGDGGGCAPASAPTQRVEYLQPGRVCIHGGSLGINTDRSDFSEHFFLTFEDPMITFFPSLIRRRCAPPD